MLPERHLPPGRNVHGQTPFRDAVTMGIGKIPMSQRTLAGPKERGGGSWWGPSSRPSGHRFPKKAPEHGPRPVCEPKEGPRAAERRPGHRVAAPKRSIDSIDSMEGGPGEDI